MLCLRKRPQRPPPSKVKPVNRLLDERQEDYKWVDRFREAEFLAVSLETTHPDYRTGIPRLLGLATDQCAEPKLFDLAKISDVVRARLVAVLQGQQLKVAYGVTEIGVHLRAINLPLGGSYFDLQLAAQLLKAGIDKTPADLQVLGEALLGDPPDKLQRIYSWTGPLVQKQQQLAANRVKALIPLREKLLQLMEERDLIEVAELEFGCLPAVMDMTRHGIRVDIPKLKEIQQGLLALVAEYRSKLQKWFPNEINLQSHIQVLAVLKKLGVSVVKVDRDSLLALDDHQDLVENLLAYRSAVTQERTYLRKCLELVDPVTSRIHPHWNQLGAATGRFSCAKPPLQGIPKHYEIRSCFIPTEGCALVIGDLSQIELRVAAEMSGDKRMIGAFQDGDDLHLLTASLLADKSPDEVSKEERQAAKAVNFGLLFGMGDDGLRSYAKSKYGVDLTASEAQSLRAGFFEVYPNLAGWVEEQMMNQKRETWTLSGRRRRWIAGSVVATELINAPIQGTAADILKMALGLLPAALADCDAKIIACIHDEIIVEVETGQAKQVATILKNTMEEAGRYFLKAVPTVAEVRIGSSWAEK